MNQFFLRLFFFFITYCSFSPSLMHAMNLEAQLNTLQTNLGKLKGKLGQLKNALADLKDSLEEKPKKSLEWISIPNIDEFINSHDANVINELNILRPILIATNNEEAKENILKELKTIENLQLLNSKIELKEGIDSLKNSLDNKLLLKQQINNNIKSKIEALSDNTLMSSLTNLLTKVDLDAKSLNWKENVELCIETLSNALLPGDAEKLKSQAAKPTIIFQVEKLEEFRHAAEFSEAIKAAEPYKPNFTIIKDISQSLKNLFDVLAKSFNLKRKNYNFARSIENNEIENMLKSLEDITEANLGKTTYDRLKRIIAANKDKIKTTARGQEILDKFGI